MNDKWMTNWGTFEPIFESGVKKTINRYRVALAVRSAQLSEAVRQVLMGRMAHSSG